MGSSPKSLDVYLEIGKKRTFAGALDWPGWCRRGRAEDEALRALLDAAARYRPVAGYAGLDFPEPGDIGAFRVVERLEGTSSTDFGAPGEAPSADDEPVESGDLERLRKVLRACWRTFDEVVEGATGRELRKGPRGGGRTVEGIVEHVLGAEAGYLRALGHAYREAHGDPDPREALRGAMLEGLELSAAGEIPARGPRGGVRWSPRYFVRRVAWHALDHAWEIEDRVIPA